MGGTCPSSVWPTAANTELRTDQLKIDAALMRLAANKAAGSPNRDKKMKHVTARKNEPRESAGKVHWQETKCCPQGDSGGMIASAAPTTKTADCKAPSAGLDSKSGSAKKKTKVRGKIEPSCVALGRGDVTPARTAKQVWRVAGAPESETETRAENGPHWRSVLPRWCDVGHLALEGRAPPVLGGSTYRSAFSLVGVGHQALEERAPPMLGRSAFLPDISFCTALHYRNGNVRPSQAVCNRVFGPRGVSIDAARCT